MTGKQGLKQRGVERMRAREGTVGIEPEDEAARWLAEHDPTPPPAAPKSLKKSVTLHRFRQRQGRA